MSARYVWEKHEISSVFGIKESTVQEYSVEYISSRPLGVYDTEYEIKIHGGKPCFYVDKYNYINTGLAVPEGDFIFPCPNYNFSKYFDVMLKAPTDKSSYPWQWWWRSANSDNPAIIILLNFETKANASFTVCRPEVKSQEMGDSIGTVSNVSRSRYSDNGISGDYWYLYKGSDNIEPSAVCYSKSELVPGESITVSVTPRTPTYGGTIYYQYQYSIDSGTPWTNIGTKTTSTSVSVTVPEEATQFKARVLASDDMGFTSATYVTGTTLSISSMKAYVGVGGKARAVSKIYVGVNGKAREVVKGYIGVNGKARKFL